MTIADTLKEMAVRSWGCPASQVDHLWERHVAYCDANDIDSYGGILWRRLVEEAKKQDFVPVLPAASRVKAERAAEESRRRDLELKGYEQAAETFADFLTRMRAAKERGESVGEHIERLLSRSDELSGSTSFVDIMAGIVARKAG